MKKVFLSIVAIAALVVLPMSVIAQDNAGKKTSTATGHATIITPITLVGGTQNLEFGNIISNATAFTVVADATVETPTFTPDNGALLTTGLDRTVAKFTVTADPDRAYKITLPDALSLTGASGAVGTLSIDTWNMNKNATGNTFNATTPAENDIYVGGTLHASANANGSFSGTFSLVVAYE